MRNHLLSFHHGLWYHISDGPNSHPKANSWVEVYPYTYIFKWEMFVYVCCMTCTNWIWQILWSSLAMVRNRGTLVKMNEPKLNYAWAPSWAYMDPSLGSVFSGGSGYGHRSNNLSFCFQFCFQYLIYTEFNFVKALRCHHQFTNWWILSVTQFFFFF